MKLHYLVITYKITLSGGNLRDYFIWWLLTRLPYLVGTYEIT